MKRSIKGEPEEKAIRMFQVRVPLGLSEQSAGRKMWPDSRDNRGLDSVM